MSAASPTFRPLDRRNDLTLRVRTHDAGGRGSVTNLKLLSQAAVTEANFLPSDERFQKLAAPLRPSTIKEVEISGYIAI